METAKTTIATRTEEVIRAAIRAAAEAAAAKAVIATRIIKVVEADINAKITTRDHRPRTPNSNRQLNKYRPTQNKRSSRARLPRKITREVARAARTSRGTGRRQPRPNKRHDSKSLKRRKRARPPKMEAGVP